MANKTVTDEQIIAALLSNGTQRAAAAACGVDECTIYNRMNDGDFKALYNAAKADLIRAAVFNINNQLQAAINTVVEVMNDKESNPAIRLQAAQTILNNAGKFSERLASSEAAVTRQVERNDFSFF